MSCAGADEECGEKIHVRRKCGCVKNIEEIKELLKRFPTEPPCHTTPSTPNPSPASRDEECEIDNASLMTQKTIPCDLACEKLFKDQSQWIFHGKYGGTCYSSDKASATPCPPDIKNQWTHYGLKLPTPTVKERCCDGYRYNPQPQPEKLEAKPQSQGPLGNIYNKITSYTSAEAKPKSTPTGEPQFDQSSKDIYKCLHALNYKPEKSAPWHMDAKAPPKYPRGQQLSRDRFPEDLDAVKYRDLDKDQNKRFTKLMVNMLQFIQFLLTFIAILIYYCIFCYMHLVYFTLRSAVYFHQADAAMKTTIAVVTVTSLVIALNVLMKFERLVGMA